MCAAAVAIDRFSAFGATAQPANSSVKNATTVRLTAPPLSILFFMNPFICLIQPAQHRDYSTPSDKKGLIDRNPPGTNCPPASQDRARMRIAISPTAPDADTSSVILDAFVACHPAQGFSPHGCGGVRPGTKGGNGLAVGAGVAVAAGPGVPTCACEPAKKVTKPTRTHTLTKAIPDRIRVLAARCRSRMNLFFIAEVSTNNSFDASLSAPSDVAKFCS
jgi:hypothetical protein